LFAPQATVSTAIDRKKRKINDTATVHPLQKKPKFTNTTISTIVRSAIALLESEFEERKAASADFPPNISTAVIRSSIRRYEDMMDTASRLSICGTCGELVLSTDTCTLENDDFRLHVIGQDHLDCCARRGTAWDFCRHCFAALSRSTIPKYSALNRVNVTLCQNYPSALEGLTTVEECLIARCHPVGAIFKLRPGGYVASANYYALRGHMIVIPQDPGALLDILPNDDLSLQILIKVCWLGKTLPSIAELKPLLQVRKAEVLAALEFLVTHNPLYRHVRINHP
jgi:ribosomal protein L32